MTLDPTIAATLSRWLDGTDISRLELSGPEGTLTLSRSGTAPIPVPPPATSFDIKASSLGVFLDRHPLAAHALAEVGEAVAEGDPLACLEVGALLTPVRAPRAGIVTACLAQPGTLVGYGTPLFRLQPLPPADGP